MARKKKQETQAQDVVFFNPDTNVVSLLSAEQAEDTETVDQLIESGFEKISRDDIPDDPDVVTYDELVAVLKAEQEAGNDAVGVVAGPDQSGSSAGDSDAQDSGAADADAAAGDTGDGEGGTNPVERGDDEPVGGDGPAAESAPDGVGTFDGRPDPNNYRNSDNVGFIENPVAGGADPDQPNGLGDFVNGVQPKG